MQLGYFETPLLEVFFHWFSRGTFCRIGWSYRARCKQKGKCMPPGTSSLATGQSCYLLQSATGWYCKVRQLLNYKVRTRCYKVRQMLLQRATLLQSVMVRPFEIRKKILRDICGENCHSLHTFWLQYGNRLDSAALSGPAFVPPRKTAGRTSRQPCLWRNSKNIIYAPTVWAVASFIQDRGRVFLDTDRQHWEITWQFIFLVFTEYGYRFSCDHKISFRTLSNIHTDRISCKFICFAIMRIRTHWTQNVQRRAHRRSQQHDRNRGEICAEDSLV